MVVLFVTFTVVAADAGVAPTIETSRAATSARVATAAVRRRGDTVRRRHGPAG